MIQSGKPNRGSSYELLRIIAMLMIVGHHYSAHGIRHILLAMPTYSKPEWWSGSFANNIFTALLVPGGQIGAGVFFALTGYFMINKAIKLEKILKLSITVMFYSVLLLSLYIALKRLGIYSFHGYTEIRLFDLSINSFLPITSNSWWFASAYIILYLFSPIANKYLLKLNKAEFLAVIAFMWAFWYSTSVFSFAYGPLQKALFFYSVGAYLRLYSPNKANTASISLFILMWIGFAVSEYIKCEYFWGQDARFTFFRSFLLLLETSIFTPFAVVSLVKAFSGLNIGDNPIINKISETTFGVYIIHDSMVGRTLIWDGIAKCLNQYNSPYYPIYATTTILLVFATCSFIELLRIRYIEPKIWGVVYKRYLMMKNRAD